MYDRRRMENANALDRCRNVLTLVALVLGGAMPLATACGGSPAPTPTTSPSTVEPPVSSSSAPVTPAASSAPATSATTATPDAGAPTSGASGPMSAKEFVGDAGASLVEGTVGGGQAVMSGGSRKLADVQPKLDATLSNVSHCYTASIKRSGGLKNKRLNIKVTIEADGTVSSAADDGGSEVTDAELLKCVFAHYKKLKFAKVTGKTKDTATFHVVFGPDKPTP